MTSLSAAALDLDPEGCELLKSLINPPVRQPQRAWMWAAFGFTMSTMSMVVALILVASWTA